MEHLIIKCFCYPKKQNKTKQNKTRQINHTKTKLCDVIRSSQFMKPFQMLIMIMTLLKKCKKNPKSAEEEEVFFDEHEPQRELNDSMPSMKYINQPCAS